MSTVIVILLPGGAASAVLPRCMVGRVVEKPPDGMGKQESSDEPEKSPQMGAESEARTEANVEDAEGQYEQ